MNQKQKSILVAILAALSVTVGVVAYVGTTRAPVELSESGASVKSTAPKTVLPTVSKETDVQDALVQGSGSKEIIPSSPVKRNLPVEYKEKKRNLPVEYKEKKRNLPVEYNGPVDDSNSGSGSEESSSPTVTVSKEKKTSNGKVEFYLPGYRGPVTKQQKMDARRPRKYTTPVRR
jgi:hypothetical protein